MINQPLKMPHATATLNGKVIADADKWETVEGNIYVSRVYHEGSSKFDTDSQSVPALIRRKFNLVQGKENSGLRLEGYSFLLQYHR